MMEQPDPAAVGFWQFNGTKAQISGILYPKLTLHRAANTANFFLSVTHRNGFPVSLRMLYQWRTKQFTEIQLWQ